MLNVEQMPQVTSTCLKMAPQLLSEVVTMEYEITIPYYTTYPLPKPVTFVAAPALSLRFTNTFESFPYNGHHQQILYYLLPVHPLLPNIPKVSRILLTSSSAWRMDTSLL